MRNTNFVFVSFRFIYYCFYFVNIRRVYVFDAIDRKSPLTDKSRRIFFFFSFYCLFLCNFNIQSVCVRAARTLCRMFFSFFHFCILFFFFSFICCFASHNRNAIFRLSVFTPTTTQLERCTQKCNNKSLCLPISNFKSLQFRSDSRAHIRFQKINYMKIGIFAI